MKPVSFVYWRKHWQHILRPYFWIRPCRFEQTGQEQEPWSNFRGWLQYSCWWPILLSGMQWGKSNRYFLECQEQFFNCLFLNSAFILLLGIFYCFPKFWQSWFWPVLLVFQCFYEDTNAYSYLFHHFTDIRVNRFFWRTGL